MRNFSKQTASVGKRKKSFILPLATIVCGSLLGGGLAYSLLPSSSDTIPTQNTEVENKAQTQDTNETKANEVAALPPARDVAPAPKPVEPTQVSKTLSVGKGDTLMKVLTRAGAGTRDSYNAITALTTVYNPRQLKIGQDIKLDFQQETITADDKKVEQLKLISVSLQEDVDRRVAAIRKTDQEFEVKETVIELDKKMARMGGTIENSLFLSATKAGMPTRVTLDLIRIFSFDVDFQREIQAGDKFEVFFERFVDDQGRALKEGRIQWASMTLSGTKISLYRYKTKDDGFTDYYNAKGQSVRKTLMRTPIDGARLTSRFGKRKHPILGYTKMHRGADFGAPRGTPIMAAGNGVVDYAGRKGAYGNYIRIRHTSEFKTAYAHMKGFAKSIRKGKRVKQGQIIGYVGTTGRSTGPHLHYEVIKNGRQINPLSVKLPAGRKLNGKMLTAFKSHVNQIDKEIAALPMETELAKLSKTQ